MAQEVKQATTLHCSKCAIKIKHSLTDHWKEVHWPKTHKLYKAQYLYERSKYYVT